MTKLEKMAHDYTGWDKYFPEFKQFSRESNPASKHYWEIDDAYQAGFRKARQLAGKYVGQNPGATKKQILAIGEDSE